MSFNNIRINHFCSAADTEVNIATSSASTPPVNTWVQLVEISWFINNASPLSNIHGQERNWCCPHPLPFQTLLPANCSHFQK
jgi:hypothetical protein